MDYLSLIQRPFYTVKTNPATKSVVGAGPLDDFWYSTPHNDDDPSATDLLKAVPWLWRSVVSIHAPRTGSDPQNIVFYKVLTPRYGYPSLSIPWDIV